MHIAAHARSEGLVLATNNMGEFARVPAMEVENWVQAAQQWTSCGASDAQKLGDCYAKFAAITVSGRQLTSEVITTLTALGWSESLEFSGDRTCRDQNRTFNRRLLL